MDEFLSRFANDERSGEIKALVAEAELSRWTRVLQRRASQAGGAEELSAIEQAFLDCIQARTEDFRAAATKMDAFLSVFGALEDLPRDERRLVDLVRHAVSAEESTTHTEVPQAAKQLEKLIQTAEKSLSGERLSAYYQDLLRLYGDKPWAREQMQRVSSKLQSES